MADTQTKDDSKTKHGGKAADESGGMEGGMASGSAGGPSRATTGESEPPAGERTKGIDFGKGSREQTQGGADPEEHS